LFEINNENNEDQVNKVMKRIFLPFLETPVWAIQDTFNFDYMMISGCE